jgi:hypothetical protein
VGLVMAMLLVAGAEAQTQGGGKPSRLQSVTLLIRHRVFHDFEDQQTVKLRQDFILGDTDYHARVVEYVPDFSMDLKSRKVVSKSPEPKNPAFRIIVFQGKVPQDTTWALLNMPPHFARKSYFAFRVMRVDLVGHAPVIADTTSAHDFPEPADMSKGVPMGMPHAMPPRGMAPGSKIAAPPLPSGHPGVGPAPAPARPAARDTTKR